MTIMKFAELQFRIMQIKTNINIPRQNQDNHAILGTLCQNYENHLKLNYFTLEFVKS